MSARIDTPAAPAMPPAPYQYAGGDLGLNSDSGTEPWIYFYDADGNRYLTHSVQWLLQNIDLFAQGRDQDQPLACAAVHYGLGVYALMGRPASTLEVPQ